MKWYTLKMNSPHVLWLTTKTDLKIYSFCVVTFLSYRKWEYLPQMISMNMKYVIKHPQMHLVWAHINCLIHVTSLPASLLSSLLNWFTHQCLHSPLYFPIAIWFFFFLLSCSLSTEQFYLYWKHGKYIQTVFYYVPFPLGKCFFLLIQIRLY